MEEYNEEIISGLASLAHLWEGVTLRPEFSEFSYEYALTEALVDGQQHLVRPTFPTQREERRAGYDVRLDRPGYPIFLQFKLCHGMKRRTAREHAYSQLPLALPFLRMPLMPDRLRARHLIEDAVFIPMSEEREGEPRSLRTAPKLGAVREAGLL